VVDYSYDGLNRVRKETQYPQGGWPASPNGSTASQTLLTQTAYDPNGNRQSLVDPLARTSTFAYDTLNRLTGVTYSDGVTPNVSYTYDADSNRSSMGDGTGSTSYSYDEMNRLLSVVSPGASTVGYSYDLDGNRRKLIYPDGTAVTYTLDKASRLQSLLDWANHTSGYTYFADGLLDTASNPNGTTGQLTYDDARRLTQVTNKQGANTISQHTYSELDNVGNRTQFTEVLPQLTTAATASAWGDNSSQELGATSTTTCTGQPCSLTPLQVSGPSNVSLVSAGNYDSFALKSDGSAWSWGSNTNGQLGDGTTTNRSSPVQVLGAGGIGFLTGIASLSTRVSHVLALSSVGTVWAWGLNGNGQLGNGHDDQPLGTGRGDGSFRHAHVGRSGRPA
jgi:YD repeat-containing protein